ncbi:hypothetical protein [Mycobacteroides chelonae]|uniref:hypothetical protein n=1 Tax=Mycobacteroides chelonae TaxID=1774 RepID=UPI0009945F96|nr:hypothetical protein [Mycobacteroides chelonae]
MIAWNPDYATTPADTPPDPAFLLRAAAMSADLAHAAARRGDTHDAGGYAKVAADLLNEAQRHLAAVGRTQTEVVR